MKKTQIQKDAEAFIDGRDNNDIPRSAEITAQEIEDIIKQGQYVASITVEERKRQAFYETMIKGAYNAGYMRGKDARRTRSADRGSWGVVRPKGQTTDDNKP